MSFMFHPYPYADPDAVNKINVPESVKNELTKGIQNVAKKSPEYLTVLMQSELMHIRELNTKC